MHAQISYEQPSGVAELLRAVWPRHAAKHAAQAAQSSVATAKAWVQGRTTPSADTLLRMAAANEQLRAELIRRLGGHGYGVSSFGGMAATQVGGVARQDGGQDQSAVRAIG